MLNIKYIHDKNSLGQVFNKLSKFKARAIPTQDSYFPDTWGSLYKDSDFGGIVVAQQKGICLVLC